VQLKLKDYAMDVNPQSVEPFVILFWLGIPINAIEGRFTTNHGQLPANESDRQRCKNRASQFLELAPIIRRSDVFYAAA